ncbi:hypothetical protein [Rhodohalobacter sp.]|uniref:hypothetical protein n=1 Tax=Rhodohalobacter sp. TaxID=1974210 RepID=UPI002ACE540E|nr:hypothetical protein [Rhodohalobacter sp.]
MLWLIGFLVANLIAEPYLQNRLTEEFTTVSDNDAELVISEINIGFFPPSATIEGVTLAQGTDASERLKNHPVLDSKIQEITISGVGIWSLLTGGNLTIKHAEINGADLHVTSGLMDRFTDSGQSSDQPRSATIQSFTISGSSIHIYRDALASVSTQLKGIDIRVTDLDVTSDSASIGDQFGRIEFKVDSVFHKTGSEFYAFEGNQISFSTETGDFMISEFFVKPQLSPSELSARVGHEIDHFNIRSGSIQLHALDVDELIANRHFKARNFTVQKLELEISRDKNHPDKPKNERPLINTQFSNLPFGVSLDSLSLSDGYISYREWKEGQDTSGTVFFDAVEIKMANLQNLDKEQTIHAEASTMFLNETELSVNFEFSLNENGYQTITGTLDEINLEVLNPVLLPMALVRLDDGIIHSLEFNFDLNEIEAKGEFIAIYDDLSLNLLNEDDHQQNTGNRIVSFLANNIQVKSSNGGENPRTGEISYEREEGQSTVNYWWKSLRSGMKDLIQRI